MARLARFEKEGVRKLYYVEKGEDETLISEGDQYIFGKFVIDLSTLEMGDFIGDLAFLVTVEDAYHDEPATNLNIYEGSFTKIDQEYYSGDNVVEIYADYQTFSFQGGDGVDVIEAGDGIDEIHLGKGFFNFARTEGGNDRIEAGDGIDYIDGGSGDDIIKGGGGDDWLYGSTGNDKVRGGAGNDWVHGGAGDDVISGRGGDDHLNGGAGNDIIKGNAGSDWMKGAGGDDTLISHADAGIPIHTIRSIPELEEGAEWDDSLGGNEGSDTFVFKFGLNATPETAAKHADEDGALDWAGIMTENDNSHDHWVDWGGHDIIRDFNRSEGDKIVIEGHTVSVHSIEYVDSNGDGDLDSSLVHIYSDQAGFMGVERGDDSEIVNGFAHDGDYLGLIEVQGDLVELDDIEIKSSSMYSEFDTLSDIL